MTLEELQAACAQSRAMATSIEMDPEDARLVLVVPGIRTRHRARVLPGVMGIVVGTRDEPRRTIVSVMVVDVERYLKRVRAALEG